MFDPNGDLIRDLLDPVRAGWLVESSRPLTEEQLAGAREFAVDAGLTIEDRNQRGGLLALRAIATAAGVVLALLGGILGIGAAYTVILAGSSRGQLGELTRVPVVELLVIAVGVPLVAAALGWLLAGRAPPSLVRLRLE